MIICCFSTLDLFNPNAIVLFLLHFVTITQFVVVVWMWCANYRFTYQLDSLFRYQCLSVRYILSVLLVGGVSTVYIPILLSLNHPTLSCNGSRQSFLHVHTLCITRQLVVPFYQCSFQFVAPIPNQFFI